MSFADFALAIGLFFGGIGVGFACAIATLYRMGGFNIAVTTTHRIEGDSHDRL